MTYKIYKSTDTGAPQIARNPGDRKALLKACLVTGYGSGADAKAPAGWTMPFEDGHKAVFRPVTSGDDIVLRMDDSDGYKFNADGFSGMTSIDDGVTEIGGWLFNMIDSPEWTVVATDSWVFVAATRAGRQAATHFFFGAVPSLIPETPATTILGSSASEYLMFSRENTKTKSGAAKAPGWEGGKMHLAAPETGTDLIWSDIMLVTPSRVIGVMPLLKMCTANSGLQTWTEVDDNAYAIQLENGTSSIQMIMDFSDVS